MKYIYFILAVNLFLLSCKKDEKTEDKFSIGYRFINKTDFKKLGIEFITNTYFPKEDSLIHNSKYFEMNKPDTFSLLVSSNENLMGYIGCKTSLTINIRIYENVNGDSIFYSYFTYTRDPLREVAWQTVNNKQEGILTFTWPTDTATWFKIQELHDKWKIQN